VENQFREVVLTGGERFDLERRQKQVVSRGIRTSVERHLSALYKSTGEKPLYLLDAWERAQTKGRGRRISMALVRSSRVTDREKSRLSSYKIRRKIVHKIYNLVN